MGVEHVTPSTWNGLNGCAYRGWEEGGGVTAKREGFFRVLGQMVVMGATGTIRKPLECTFKESLELCITDQLKTRMLGMQNRPEIPGHRRLKQNDC